MKTFNIEVNRVDEHNIERLAEWCKGEVGTKADQAAGETRKYIQVDVVNLDELECHQAFVGDWIIQDEYCYFKVIREVEYEKIANEVLRKSEKFQELRKILVACMANVFADIQSNSGANRTQIADQATMRMIRIVDGS